MNAEMIFGKEIWYPHVTVAAIVERDNKFLLVEELVKDQLVYNQPAGHLEPDENIIAAVVRETLEESAWHFVPKYIVGIYFYKSNSGTTYQRICFAGECVQHDPQRELDTDIVRSLWLSREELIAQPEKLRSPMVLRCIDDYLQGVKYPLELVAEVV